MSGALKLVVKSSVVQLQQCALYAHGHPMLELHHVCPESWWRAAGRLVASPLMSLCPDCHYGVHVCIDARIKKQDVSLMRPRWVELASRAFTLATAHGLAASLTL